MQGSDVSVVVPAYNARQFIIPALESIERQSCLPGEVIVVNDGSSDSTADLVREWSAMRERGFAVILMDESNGGVPVARNKGIRRSKGEWIALLDADDLWEPYHLAELVGAANRAPQAVAAYGAGRLLVGDVLNKVLYDDFWDNPSLKLGKPIHGTDYLKLDIGIFERLLAGNFIKPSSLMFSARAARAVGLFDESLRSGEDREFLLRLLFAGEFVYCPKPITQYRWHDDNLSQVKNAMRNQENGLRVLHKVIGNKTLQLTARQLATCWSEIRIATRGYLYMSAAAGIPMYVKGLQTVRRLFGTGHTVRSINPKHVASGLFPQLSRLRK